MEHSVTQSDWNVTLVMRDVFWLITELKPTLFSFYSEEVNIRILVLILNEYKYTMVPRKIWCQQAIDGHSQYSKIQNLI